MTVPVECRKCGQEVGFTAGLSACCGWLDRHDWTGTMETFAVCPGSAAYVGVTRDVWESARLPLLSPETVLEGHVSDEPARRQGTDRLVVVGLDGNRSIWEGVEMRWVWDGKRTITITLEEGN